MDHTVPKSVIFELWYKTKKEERFDTVLTYVISTYGDVNLSKNELTQVQANLRSLCQKIEIKWQKCNRTYTKFLTNNEEWLQGVVRLPRVGLELVSSESNARGRPIKDFQDLCDKSKRRKAKEAVEDKSPEEIGLQAEVKLLQEGKRDSAAIVKELFEASPQRGTRLKQSRLSSQSAEAKLSPDDALSLIIDTNLSTHQYSIIREQGNRIVKQMYPAYYLIKAAKERCYPSEINITEIKVDISMQSIVDHTIERLCLAQEEVLQVVPDLQDVQLIMKWGCDGAQQSRYKQKFVSEGATDESMFSFSLVPVQLYSQIGQLKKIIWQNPVPSSTRYCRPIQFLFAKESSQLINDEYKRIEHQIENLNPTRVVLKDTVFSVMPVLIFSMIDGKVCSALSNYTSSQACFICGATPKEMNKVKLIAEKDIDEKALSFGLSPLHSRIRFMECALHIAYRLPLKVWRVMGEENKNIVKQRKKQIQDAFKNEMGLLVDIPTQQSGNTNDGNTARRFFRNYDKTAEITGVDVSLIKHFYVILEAINCGYSINSDLFDKYTNETLDIYLKHYQWYPMPSSVHKVLCHGAAVIRSCILPIGQLSEEAQESGNKQSRKFRELFTRKCSRIATNTDLIHRMLISSDPFIASKRHIPKRGSRKMLCPEVIPLLSAGGLECGESADSDSEVEDNSD